MCADWKKIGGGVWAFFGRRRRRGVAWKKAIFGGGGGGVARRDVIVGAGRFIYFWSQKIYP